MSAAQPGPKRRPAQIAALLARWLLGALFICLGLTKVFHKADYTTFVQQQLMVADPALSGIIVVVAPWLEVLYGLWLFSGVRMDLAALLARWWLGCVFIFMGLHKALPHPEDFHKLVRDYELVSNPYLLNAIAAALPWFEVYCGVLLLAGVAVRAAALNIIVMLVPFTLIVLRRAIIKAGAAHIPFCAVKFDCGCGAGEVYICNKLVENTALFLLAAWMLTSAGRRLCLRFTLRRDKAPLGQQAGA